MFIKLLTLFIILGVAAATASWLSAQPGEVQVEWLGWRMELPTSLALAFIIAFALVFVFFDRLSNNERSSLQSIFSMFNVTTWPCRPSPCAQQLCIGIQ